MIHLSTIKLLREWARWGEAHNIDYPSMSPMFGERTLKGPLFGIGHIPPDVYRIEICVCQLDFDLRDALIQRYQRKLTWEKMGLRIGCDWRTAKNRVRSAEDAVHHGFSKSDCSLAPTGVCFAQDSKTASTEPA